jgi:type I restriction enzyme M protein
VSLPQTTFKSTGAGEKSSILFLRKRTHAQTTHLLETKTSLRLNVAEKGRLTERLAEIESVRKTEHKNLDARREFVALSPNERKKNTAYKQEADKIAARAEKATAALRGELSKLFDRKLKADFPDEDVFMAIAEDVGFDAAGKPTKVNELEEIGKRLAEFIRQEAGTH